MNSELMVWVPALWLTRPTPEYPTYSLSGTLTIGALPMRLNVPLPLLPTNRLVIGYMLPPDMVYTPLDPTPSPMKIWPTATTAPLV